MADLLPCPHCGSAEVGEPIRRRPLQVACIDCGAEGPEALTHDDARSRWNTRAPNPRLAEARALLTECAAEVEARGVDPSLAAAVRAWLGVVDG